MTARHSGPTLMDAAAESERNRLLRRADWRYLLPSAEPGRVLCLGGAELRAACAVIGSHVDDAIAAGETYDLVVAENPDAGTLRAMAGTLRPGGVCYTEWTRLSFRGAARTTSTAFSSRLIVGASATPGADPSSPT